MDFRRTLGTEEPFDLLVDLAAGRFLAEGEAGDCDRNDDERRHCEDGIVSQRRTETECSVGHPLVEALHKQRTPGANGMKFFFARRHLRVL